MANDRTEKRRTSQYGREAIGEYLHWAFPLGDSGSFAGLPNAIKDDDQRSSAVPDVDQKRAERPFRRPSAGFWWNSATTKSPLW